MKDIIPAKVISHIIETMLNRRFDHDLFGLRPAHPLFHEHPTVNDQVASKILCGVISIKGDIKEMREREVSFEGEQEGQQHEVDVVLLATGFHVDYAFLSEDLRRRIVNTDNNSVNLYKYVFPLLEGDDEEADRPTASLAFIGVPNALGPLFPVAEIQSRWVVQVLKGHCHLPSISEMRKGLQDQEAKRKA
jgi:dimethylaniline monooxygenase (N-oxide forming)